MILWCCLIASAAIASEEHRAKIKIEIDGDDNGHSVFKFDSQDTGVDLFELGEGESETFTDDDGNEVTVTRNDDGFEFETIDISI